MKKKIFTKFQGPFIRQIWKNSGQTFKPSHLILFRMSICCFNRALCTYTSAISHKEWLNVLKLFANYTEQGVHLTESAATQTNLVNVFIANELHALALIKFS